MTRKLGPSTRDRSWLVTGAMCATGALGLLVAAAVSSYLRLPQLIKPIHFECCPHEDAAEPDEFLTMSEWLKREQAS